MNDDKVEISLVEEIELEKLMVKESHSEIEKKRFENLQWRYKSARVEEFLDEFLRPIFPKARFVSSFSMGNPRATHQFARLGGPKGNRAFIGSDYYYGDSSSQLLSHYTSVEGARGILSSKTLRLKCLDSMNDPQELISVASNFGFNKESVEQMRINFFSASFNKFQSQENDEKLAYWKNYGKDGQGVALIFEVDTQYLDHWHEAHLSEIQYDHNKLESVLKRKDEMDRWMVDRKFYVQDVFQIFSKVFCFHKHKMFDFENEVRLLKYADNPFGRYGLGYRDKEYSVVKKWDSDDWQSPSYVELPLGVKFEEDVIDRMKKMSFSDDIEPAFRSRIKNHFKSVPRLRLDRIILGYKIPFDSELRQELEQLGEGMNGSQIEVVQSSIYDYFNAK